MQKNGKIKEYQTGNKKKNTGMEQRKEFFGVSKGKKDRVQRENRKKQKKRKRRREKKELR